MVKFYDLIPHSEFEKRANRKMFWATVILMVALLVGIGWGILTAPSKEIKSDLDLLPPQVVEQVINGEFK